MQRKKTYLKSGDVALGSPDDIFYIGESWFRKGGQVVGKELGMTPKQITRKNKLLKNLKEMESKAHATHSPLQRKIRLTREFQKPMLDAKIKKLKKVLKKYPKVSY